MPLIQDITPEITVPIKHAVKYDINVTADKIPSLMPNSSDPVNKVYIFKSIFDPTTNINTKTDVKKQTTSDFKKHLNESLLNKNARDKPGIAGIMIRKAFCKKEYFSLYSINTKK